MSSEPGGHDPLMEKLVNDLVALAPAVASSSKAASTWTARPRREFDLNDTYGDR